MNRQNNDRLHYWQDLLGRAEIAYDTDIAKMDRREKLYRGTEELRPLVDGHKSNESTRHVRNIIAENIESEVDSNIPQPKVTPRRAEDEERAKIIEDLIRNELDRLPMEELNDLMERLVPIQGGGYWLLEWDDTIGSFYRTGENVVSVIHPKAVIPQDGVTSNIEDMDYIVLKQPETKGYVRRRWGKNVDDESEEEPDIRGIGEDSEAEDLVTIYVVYYKDDAGKINKFVWCNNTVLEDIEDYQARRHKRCKNCGALLPFSEDRIRQMRPLIPESEKEIEQAAYSIGAEIGEFEADKAVQIDTSKPKEEKLSCPYCGSEKLENTTDNYEYIIDGFTTNNGIVIPSATMGVDDDGNPIVKPTAIPSYKPNVYPVILQRNVTLYGQLLGDSDVDKIEPQQNALNWHMRKIDDRLLGAGSVIVLPRDAGIDIDPIDNRIWRAPDVASAQSIRVVDFGSDLQYNFAQVSQIYEAARNILGITDSFQGRKDTTATSGRAKEFAAAQSAGRLESKRVLKASAWAKLFELIFKFTLAYAEEPRQISNYGEGDGGNFREFNRWDFLEQDPSTGEYYWNDDFIFSCDTSAPLASNRSALWDSATQFLQYGAFGEPQNPETLKFFWTQLSKLHHPLGESALRFLKNSALSEMPQIPSDVVPPSEEQADPSLQAQGGFISPNGNIIN